MILQMAVFDIVVSFVSRRCLIGKLYGANYIERRSNPITDL